jgi:hypothetical protein
MGNHALMTLLAWPYPGRERLPAALIARLIAAGLLPLSDTPTRRAHNGHGPTVLSGDNQGGPILAGTPAHHAAHLAMIAELVTAGLHVYAGRTPAGGYCAVWDYHPPGAVMHAVRHRCCCRHPLRGAELAGDPDDATECELNRWARLMLGSPAGVPAMVLLAAH